VLLIDTGLAGLAIPDGQRRPPQIPTSLLAATPDTLDAEPTVLEFLAGCALRRSDLPGSLRYREHQWAASQETDTTTRPEPADVIRRLALTNPDSTARELQRALGHATAATHERRR
jgi:hypothetical protein